jgi:hypothetical protein
LDGGVRGSWSSWSHNMKNRGNELVLGSLVVYLYDVLLWVDIYTKFQAWPRLSPSPCWLFWGAQEPWCHFNPLMTSHPRSWNPDRPWCRICPGESFGMVQE